MQPHATHATACNGPAGANGRKKLSKNLVFVIVEPTHRRQSGLQAHLAVSNSVALDLELEPHSEEVPNTVSYELVETTAL